MPILILAGFLRLWGLADQPVLYFDSGQYLGEARFLSSVARAAATAMLDSSPQASPNPLERIVRATEHSAEAHAPDNAKVGHAILLATSMLIFGTNTFAAVFVSALAAIGTVAATYAIGMQRWGPRVAIPAAMLLAVSGWHLTYSREAYAEADLVLFATLGFLLYLRAAGFRALALSGVLLGLAFSCNTRASYLPLILLPTELLGWRARGWRDWHSTLNRAAAIVSGFVAPLLLIQGAYLIARGVGRAFGSGVAWPDYVQQLAAYWQQHPVIVRWDQWPTFFVDLALLDGIPTLLLLIVGVLAVVKRPKRGEDVLLLVALLLPVALYSVYVAGAVRMRAFSLALPWIMLTTAVGLDALVTSVRSALRMPRSLSTPTLAIMTAALVLLAVPRAHELITAPDGVPSLMTYLNKAQVADVASTDGAVLGFFVGEEHTNSKFRVAYINTPEDLDQLAQRYRFLAVDMQGYLFPKQVAERYLAARPVFASAHGSPTWYLASLLENRGVRWGEWDLLLADWKHYVSAATELRLVDLRELVHD